MTGTILFVVQCIELQAEATLGQRSAHSFATGPVMRVPK